MRVDYLDFDLLIERSETRARVRVLDSPVGQASGDFEVPFSREQLEIFVLRAIGLGARRRVRRIESPEMKEIKAFGGRLFEATFDGEVLSCLRRSLDEAERRGAGLRIRLRIEDAPEPVGVPLIDVPWELLYDEGGPGFLCLSDSSPIVRYPDLPQRIKPLTVTPPLKVLAIVSSPANFPPLDVAGEWTKLEEALRGLVQRNLVNIDRLDAPTLEALQRRLRRGEYHVLHFIGHGEFDERAQDGVLMFEDGTGRGQPVSGEFLRALFHNHPPLRLVILNACEGARTSPTDPYAGTAQSLVRGGLSAVIAMQFEISDEAAIAFTSEFYTALADGYPVDAALTEARTAIFTRVSAMEWAIPVLYLRSPDGQIFDVQAGAGVEAREPQGAEPPPGPHTQVAVALGMPAHGVQPGSEQICDVRVRNTGDTGAQFVLEVLGPGAAWATLDPALLALAPGEDGRSRIRFQPPTSPDTTPGSVPFEVKVASKDQPDVFAIGVGSLDVRPFVRLSARLSPRKSARRRLARFRVAVRNLGNTPARAVLTAKDSAYLDFDIEPKELEALPGAEASADLDIRSRSLALWRTTLHRFELNVASELADPLTVNGEFVQRSARLRLAGVLIMLGLIAAALVLSPSGNHAGPTTSLTLKPDELIGDEPARFIFSSSEADVRFTCTLDGGTPEPCQSEAAFAGLSHGSHTLSVRATNAAGNVGDAVAYSWRVDRNAPIVEFRRTPTANWGETTASTSATFEWTSPDKTASYRCGLEQPQAQRCESGWTRENLGPGPHTFYLKAIDPQGNSRLYRWPWTIVQGGASGTPSVSPSPTPSPTALPSSTPSD